VVCREQALEAGTPSPQRLACQIGTLTAQHVKGEQHRGRLLRGPSSIARTHAKPLLECAEVGTAIGVGDHNLTVDHGVQRKHFRRAHELRERDAQVLQVPAEDPRRARVGSPRRGVRPDRAITLRSPKLGFESALKFDFEPG
jgi:hypothetical protein